MNSNPYEYQHIIGFEETNLVGNVYYSSYISWQGRCREMFLYDNAPEILHELSQGLALATVRVNCEYYSELFAFNKIVIRMHLGPITQNRITMLFEYWRLTNQGEELVAKGEQQVACMKRDKDKLTPTPIPMILRQALEAYLMPVI